MGNWNNSEIIAFSFLFLGSLFTYSLIRSVIKLLNYEWPNGDVTLKDILKIFSIPLVSFLFMLIFIFVILPYF